MIVKTLLQNEPGMRDVSIAIRLRKTETVAGSGREFKTGESDEGKVAKAKILRPGSSKNPEVRAKYWNGLFLTTSFGKFLLIH